MTGKRRYTPDEKASYFTLRDRGWTRAAAAREIGCSYDTAIAWDKLRSRPSGHVSGARKKDSIQFMRGIEPPPPLVPGRDHLNEHALRALDDFEFFRARYLGHLSTPWQIEAAETMVRLLKTPEKEWVVVNCPPGSGKTTLFSLDIPLWLIVRDRAVRIFVGSRTFKMATTYTGRIRNMLARTMPAPPDEENIAKGLAVEPTGCLAVDFGRFRPEAKELWRRDEFVVEQTSGEGSVEKEATVTAWGRDTDFLGFRADFVVWDDLVTSKGLKTIEAIEADREWFEDEAETRLEPGGVFCLQGQRMGPEDLYRHALNMRTGDEDEVESPPKYRHIVYKAHYEDVCRQLHKRTDPPYDPKNPESGGCLLDPRRLLWSELQTARRNRESKYRVQYQQEDVDPSRVLVRKAWIDGGTDPEDGSICPGCWDDRNILEVPNGLVPPVYRVATCDPSPSRYWAIEDWLYHPATGQRFLLNLVKQVMTAPEFLDCNRGVYSGLMHDWQLDSQRSPYPIVYWIIENNAAQRWLLQYGWMHDWMRQMGVRVIGHNTNVRNKLDENYGLESIANVYRDGLVRLPAGNTAAGGRLLRDQSRQASLKLVDEATRYDTERGGPDDCLMAHWFLEFHIAKGTFVSRANPKARRLVDGMPSWMRRSAA